MPYDPKFATTLYDRDWLYRVYVTENRNAAQIAVMLDCNRTSVHNALKKHGIEVKQRSEAQKLAVFEEGRGSSSPRPKAQFRDTLHNADWLYENYVVQRRTAAEIARMVGCSAQSAWEAIRKHMGVASTVRSTRDPDELAEGRARRVARQLFPERQPCIVCPDPEGTRNHKNGDFTDNRPENIEWLCLRHHNMVDKRLMAWAANYVKKTSPESWMRWHDTILEEVRQNPDRPTRTYSNLSPFRPKTPDSTKLESVEQGINSDKQADDEGMESK